MRDRPGSQRIDVSLSVEPRVVAARPEAETPFCIALFGDFSARAHRGILEHGQAILERQPVLVDRDNLDAVLARLQPELDLHLHSERDAETRIRFTRLEDFHPDDLYERLPVFAGVRELRRRLAEPAPRADPPRASRSSRASGPSPANLLDQIVQQSPDLADERSPLEGGDLQAYLNRIVAPHLVPAAEPRRQALVTELDDAAAGGMRALLHHPAFQTLEALWRGVQRLVYGIESDTEVRLYLIDVTKAELAAAPAESVYRLLAEPPAEVRDAGWGALGGLYSFTPEPADLGLLSRLGVVARLIGAPWIGGADPRLVGCSSIHQRPDPREWAAAPDPGWEALRRTPEARSIGLAFPRFLLRLPYGERGVRCETLPFEEFPDHPVHEEYLWGNPVFACLLLLAQAVAASGRAAYPGMNLELGGLPLYDAATRGGATQPCAEALLSERAAERILDAGLMALMSVRDADRIRLLRFQSIAEPAAPLVGRRMVT